jgi:hypothetical protein
MMAFGISLDRLVSRTITMTVLLAGLEGAGAEGQQPPLLPVPELSVRYFDYDPSPALAWAGPDTVLLLDKHMEQAEVRDLRSGTTRRIGREGGGPGEFQQVSDVVVGPEGDIYVTDGILQRVTRFAPDGAVRATYPTPQAPLELLASRDRVYVVLKNPGARSGPAVLALGEPRHQPDPLFRLADVAPGLLAAPADAVEMPFALPLAVGLDGRFYAAAFFAYEVVVVDSTGDRLGEYHRDIPLQYPDEEAVAEREQRLRDNLRRSTAGVDPNSPAVKRMFETFLRQPEPFFMGRGLAIDHQGGIWLATRLSGTRDSTRVDYIEPDTGDIRHFTVPDWVFALAVHGDRVAVLVERQGEEALGRFGLDVYRAPWLERASPEAGGGP